VSKPIPIDQQQIRSKRLSLGLSAIPDLIRGDMAAVERWKRLFEEEQKKKKKPCS
jgi:hypothetical protein